MVIQVTRGYLMKNGHIVKSFFRVKNNIFSPPSLILAASTGGVAHFGRPSKKLMRKLKKLKPAIRPQL